MPHRWSTESARSRLSLSSRSRGQVLHPTMTESMRIKVAAPSVTPVVFSLCRCVAASLCHSLVRRCAQQVHPTVMESMRILAAVPNVTLVIFSGCGRSRLEDEFDGLPVWLAAVRSPPSTVTQSHRAVKAGGRARHVLTPSIDRIHIGVG
eukprot:4905148-Pyramimonas_sp.AAC.2